MPLHYINYVKSHIGIPLVMAIKVAQIHCQIFERLYSADALKITYAEHNQQVHGLATSMQQWYSEY
jgi:hypothetical protein